MPHNRHPLFASPLAVTRRHFNLGLATLLAGFALRDSLAADTPHTPVRFALNRGPYDSSNAPFLLARDKGWFAEEGLNVDFSLSRNVVDAIKRVASNECDFGYADFSVVTHYAAENPDTAPHLLYSIFDRSPSAIVTWKSAGVTRVSDLVGKTLAVTPGDGAFQLFPAFCRASGLDPKQVKLVEVDLDARETLMHERKVDGAIGFDSTIFQKLRQAGDTLDALNFLYYADAGLALYSNGIIVSRQALAEHRPRIAGLLRACARGWQASLETPSEMLKSLAQAQPQANLSLEAERFEWIRNQQIMTANVREHGMGTIDRSRFERLSQLIVPDTPVSALAGLVEPDFLPPLNLRKV